MQSGDYDGSKHALFKPNEPIKAEKWLTNQGKLILAKRVSTNRKFRRKQLTNAKRKIWAFHSIIVVLLFIVDSIHQYAFTDWLFVDLLLFFLNILYSFSSLSLLFYCRAKRNTDVSMCRFNGERLVRCRYSSARWHAENSDSLFTSEVCMRSDHMKISVQAEVLITKQRRTTFRWMLLIDCICVHAQPRWTSSPVDSNQGVRQHIDESRIAGRRHAVGWGKAGLSIVVRWLTVSHSIENSTPRPDIGFGGG